MNLVLFKIRMQSRVQTLGYLLDYATFSFSFLRIRFGWCARYEISYGMLNEDWFMVFGVFGGKSQSRLIDGP